MVESCTRRFQLQERLRSQIADIFMEELDPVGVAVMGSAQHLCMTLPGVRKPGSGVVTSTMRGVFRAHETTPLEFFVGVRSPLRNANY